MQRERENMTEEYKCSPYSFFITGVYDDCGCRHSCVNSEPLFLFEWPEVNAERKWYRFGVHFTLSGTLPFTSVAEPALVCRFTYENNWFL
jgi:hypothetical protein